MDDPVTRIFLVLEILQGRDLVTGAELAQRLAVDLRTVQRYMVRLKSLGIPIASSRGVGGAYRMRPGHRLPPILLTNEEAFALTLGLGALRQVGLADFAPATAGALAKLQRVLPNTLRESIQTVEDVIAIDPSPWVQSTSVAALTIAATAIRTGHRIRFTYQAHNKETTRREIEPYAVIHSDARWYLIGHCIHRRALRTFRLDRVTKMATRSTTFEGPAAFDARAYLAAQMPFISSNFQIDVWIDLPLAEAEQSFAIWRVAMQSEDGGTRLRCGRDTLELFAAMLLATNRRIIVHQPAALRKTFRTLARRARQAAEKPAPRAR